MNFVRTAFHVLAATAAVGIVALAVASWRASGATPDIAAVAALVPVAGMTSLAGIWAGTLAILEPPDLTALDHRIGRGVLVALTATGPVSLLLVSRSF